MGMQSVYSPVKWRVEYKPPGGVWTVLTTDSGSPSGADGKITRSYQSPQGALGTWEMRVIFEPVPSQVWVQTNYSSDNGATGHYETISVPPVANSVKARSLKLSYSATITGKTTSRYKRPFYIKLPKPGPWDIRIGRSTANSASSYLQNQTWWDSLKTTVESKLSYPNSAYGALTVDAEQFDNVPTRAYDIYGLLVKIPSNYDPVGRTYTGLWDGTFKLDWTNNPAWVFYDLITENRYGLGDLIDESLVDKWGLYAIAQYCDKNCHSGYGYLEPRFTCNAYIQTREDAYKLITSLASVFRGMAYWSAAGVTTVADRPADPVYLFTNANVIDGEFSYAGTGRSARHTVALVTWNNPNNMYRQEVEYVEDADGVSRYGINETEVAAFGCTSRGQAHRAGKWILYTEQNETEIVSFKTGLEHVTVFPGAVILVADNLRSGDRIGGRLIAATTTQFTLDSEVTLEPGVSYSIVVVRPNGKCSERVVTNAPGTTSIINVSVAVDDAPQEHSVWVLSSDNLDPQWFRVLSVSEAEGGQADITALSHNPSKYAHIESDQVLEELNISNIRTTAPDPVENITCSDTLYLQGPGVVGTKLHASWEGSASRFNVTWRQGQNNWQTFSSLTNSADIAPVEEGPLSLKVMALDTLGRQSAWVAHEYVVLGKQALPATPSGFVAEVTSSGIALTWAPNTDLDLLEYEVRVNGVNPTRVSATKWLWPYTPVGDTTFALYAVDTTAHLSEPATTVATITVPAVPVVEYAFNGPDVILTITTPASQLPLDRYNIRRGASYATGVDLGDIYATTFKIRAAWAGSRTFWVSAIDKANNSGAAGAVSVTVVAPAAPVVTAQAIDNNVLLYWTCAHGSLPIDTFELRKGAVWASAEIIGTKSGGFTTVFETSGGNFTYQLAAIDSAGNYGAATSLNVTVSQPPDYVLRADIDAEVANTGSPSLYTRLTRTLSSAILEAGVVKLPINMTETFDQHFSTRSWASPQAQVAAGYPYYAQPNIASGYYEETIDYGAALASSKITVTPTGSTLYGTVAVSVLISTKLNSGDAWTDFADTTQVYATNFRYIRVRVTVFGAASMYQLNGINVRLDSKIIGDGGMVSCSATDVGGTQVLFNRSFIDVTNIQVTASGTTPVTALYDFTDTGNPTGFKVLLFNSAGARISGTASWSAEGY